MKASAWILAVALLFSNCQTKPASVIPVWQSEKDTKTTEDVMPSLLSLNGILSGSIDGADTKSLILIKDGVKTKIPDQTISFASNGAGNPRADLIQWNGKTFSVKQGSTAVNPNSPSPDAGYIPVGVMYLPPSWFGTYPLGRSDLSSLGGAGLTTIYTATHGMYCMRKMVGLTPQFLTSTAASPFVDIVESCIPAFITDEPGFLEISINIKAAQNGLSKNSDIALELNHGIGTSSFNVFSDASNGHSATHHETVVYKKGTTWAGGTNFNLSYRAFGDTTAILYYLDFVVREVR